MKVYVNTSFNRKWRNKNLIFGEACGVMIFDTKCYDEYYTKKELKEKGFELYEIKKAVKK